MSKKLFSLLFLFVVLVETLVSCKSTSVSPPTKTETSRTVSVKEVVRDTIFETKEDSSYYKAWLECRKGQVLIKSTLQKTKGKYLAPPKITLKNNYLTVDCEAEAQKLFAQWKDIYKTTNMQTVTTKPVEVEKKLTWWQQLQIWCGRIFLLLLLTIIVLSVLRWRRII
jgi:hypothetical protein